MKLRASLLLLWVAGCQPPSGFHSAEPLPGMGGPDSGTPGETWRFDVIACARANENPCSQPIAGATVRIGAEQQTANGDGYTLWSVPDTTAAVDAVLSAQGFVTTTAHVDVAATHDGRGHNIVYVARAHRDPATVPLAVLRHVTGDFGGIYLPELAPQCPEDPVTHIRCRGDNGGTPHGLLAGALFTASYFIYTPEQRAKIRAAYSARGYTHFPLSIFPNVQRSYHALYPPSTPDGAELNALLQELWDNDGRPDPIIPICFVMEDSADAVTLPAGFDKGLCRIVVPKWEQDGPDGNDTVAINRHAVQVRAAFPDARLYFHFTAQHAAGGSPEADWWNWAVNDPLGPKAVGLLYQDDRWNDPTAVKDRTIDFVIRLGAGYHGWPNPVDVVLFETDIYTKFWDGRTEAEGIAFNDAVLGPLYRNRYCYAEGGVDYCGQLMGFTSGGTKR